MNNSDSDGTRLRLIIDAKAELAEGAFWNYKDQTLWWVDIEGMSLHIYNPDAEKDRIIPVGSRIGTVVPSIHGGAIVALQNGIHYLDLESERLKLITNPLENLENIRFNDGKCDPSGRFWVGSMELETKENAASLYRVNLDNFVDEVLAEVTISNGIVWAQDRKTMYYIDTPTSKVLAFDYDDPTGNISNPKAVIEIPESDGKPDGMAIDSEGKLWIAHYGGYCVGRWDHETGKMLQKINIPAPNVTSCAFGGEDLETLFITTAREGMEDEALREFPASGGVFACRPGIKGIKMEFFKGNLPQ